MNVKSVEDCKYFAEVNMKFIQEVQNLLTFDEAIHRLFPITCSFHCPEK